MTTRLRSFIAAALMSVGLVALVVDSANHGWSTLDAVGVGCFVLAIAAQLLAMRTAKPHE